MQYVGIQTQQSRNNRRSVLLLFLFPCLVAALLYLACYLLAAMGHGESMEVSILELANPLFINALPYTMGVVLIWFQIAFWANMSIIKAATGAKPLDRRENKRVYNLVENLCMANGMKTPKINIIDDDSLNAFASGINDRTYTVTLERDYSKVERRRTGSSHRPRTDSHPQQRCAPADRLDCICRNLLDADADHFLYYYARAHT